MSILIVSSKGQVVLPAETRRKLGLEPGSRLELSDEPNGVRLQVIRPVPATEVAQLAGMVKAKSRGSPRRLEDFDPASLVGRSTSK